METKNHLIRIVFFLFILGMASGCKKDNNEEIPVSYSVSVTTDGNGTATANPVKAEKGKSVTLTATPNSEFVFKQWVVVSGDITITNTTANPATFSMPAGNVSIKAEFNSSSAPSYSISVTTDGNGTAAANSAEAVEGVTVTLTATPNSEFVFKQWIVVSGGITLADATANPATFVMPASNVSVKAEFNSSSAPLYSVSVTTDGNGTAAASPAEAAEGVTVALAATPGNGFEFKQWVVVSGEISLADATANPATFVMPAGNVSVKAEFKESGSEPDSEFWDEEQYAQNRLRGNVKTIRETNDRYPGEYTLIEYDSKGRLLKEFDHEQGWFRGYTYTYDSKGRLTKAVTSNTDNGDYDITEIGYDGRHNKFIPTNFAVANVRLQRGVTSLTNVYKGELQVKVNLQSVNGDRMIFKAEVIDLLAREFGSNELTITADFKGDFPAVVKIASTNDETTEMKIEYFDNGMPAKISYKAIYDLTQESVFKAGASFMLLESEKTVRNGRTNIETYEYDEKGNCILSRENGENSYRCQYEYDSAGNWTERIEEDFSSGQWEYYTTMNREYTYW